MSVKRKNIHILPTEKPSRLYYNGTSYKDPNSTMAMDWFISSAGYKPQNIYITNDDEIKEGDYFLYNKTEVRFKSNGTEYHGGELCHISGNRRYSVDKCKKIVLTTDQDLINVQAINDEFLEWFVKNPSCEFVEVEEKSRYFNIDELRERFLKGLPHIYSERIGYKIIIPKEETKHLLSTEVNKERLLEDIEQETLKDKLESLVIEWHQRQIHYEDVAQDNIASEHNYKKFTYKAMATRDCWKELLTLLNSYKDEK